MNWVTAADDEAGPGRGVEMRERRHLGQVNRLICHEVIRRHELDDWPRRVSSLLASYGSEIWPSVFCQIVERSSETLTNRGSPSLSSSTARRCKSMGHGIATIRLSASLTAGHTHTDFAWVERTSSRDSFEAHPNEARFLGSDEPAYTCGASAEFGMTPKQFQHRFFVLEKSFVSSRNERKRSLACPGPLAIPRSPGG